MAPLGNLVRLLPLDLNEVPTHSYLDPTIPAASSANNGKATANERPNLLSFIEEVLDQATTFAHDTLPATFRSKGNKTSKPAVAKVELLSRMIPSSDIEQVPWMNSSIPRNWSGNVKKKPREAWFARRSLHANASSEGTADLDEFDYGLRHNHSKHEQDYTPDVFDTYRVLDWSEQIAAELSKGHLIDGYSQVDMSIHEMCHRLPAMLSNRVFPVLILTAKRGKHAFIVVQIPIDIRNLSESMYSNGRNQTMGGSKLKRQKPVLGVYTSIESCQMLPNRDVEWIMATASDAKGWLPMWAQKLGVPGAVVKDVGLFIKWIRGKPPLTRPGGNSPAMIAAAATSADYKQPV